ncbi:MAG TPA: hypothetical protein VGI56_08925 [Galbitalea sp.]|jgi:hypothetical protein
MRRTVRTIATLLFIGVALACIFAVLYFGTLTGLTFGGEATQMSTASKTSPIYAQVGWLRNTSPWPITITKITTNASQAKAQPVVYVELKPFGAKVVNARPNWSLSAEQVPYQLDGGSLRYLGFSLDPAANQVASITSITVEFKGPMGFTFHQTFTGANIAAASPTLPAGLLADDPTGDPASLDAYILLLRAGIEQGDQAELALIMGPPATPAQAKDLLAQEKGYHSKSKLTATPIQHNVALQKLVFYNGDPVKGALPPITVQWEDFRWHVVVPPAAQK